MNIYGKSQNKDRNSTAKPESHSHTNFGEIIAQSYTLFRQEEVGSEKHFFLLYERGHN